MKSIIVLAGFLVLAVAKNIGDDIPSVTETDTEYEYPISSSDASIIDLVPTPSGYPAPTLSSVLPIPEESSVEAPSSIEECSTLSTTVTLTQTIPIATVIPSHFSSVTGAIDLSSWMPSQPESQPTPFFSTTTQQSSVAEPLESSPMPTLPLMSESSTAEEGGESSAHAPLAPEPTLTGKPVEGTATTMTSVEGSETGSYTSTSEPALFTDAARTLGVPRVVAGVIGWAALLL